MRERSPPAKAATTHGGRIRSRICRLLRTVPTVAPTAAHTTEKKKFEEALAGKEIVPPEETDDEAPDEDEDEAPVMRM